MSEERPQKLRARDPDDLKVVSALLQDALVPIGEATYQGAQKRFVLVVNRFMWERNPEGPAAHEPESEGAPGAGREGEADSDASFAAAERTQTYQRTNCGVCFDQVERVRYRAIDLRTRHQILNLLAIEAGGDHVDLLFSDGAAIRLEVSGIACHLEDLGEPWPTRWRPGHALDEATGRR